MTRLLLIALVLYAGLASAAPRGEPQAQPDEPVFETAIDR
jgi:hypothetical protein